MDCKCIFNVVAFFSSGFVASSLSGVEVLKLAFQTDKLNISENCFQNPSAWER